MNVREIQTGLFREGSDLSSFVHSAVPARPPEKSILAVTSKLLSLAENCRVKKAGISKRELVRREADVLLGEIGYGSILTIKEGILLVSAGVDESNSESGDFLTLPKNPFLSARRLYEALQEKWQLSEFGILVTDSKTSPLRLGVCGVSLSYWGFRGLKDCVGQRDLFHRELTMTKVNVADGLAAAATVVMGEGGESRPLALLSDFPEGLVTFAKSGSPEELRMVLKDDMYWPLIEAFQDRNK